MAMHNDNETFADIIRRRARACGADEALVFRDRRATYADLDRASNRIAQRLLNEGLKPQTRIAYLGKNSDAFYEIWFGAAKVRAVLTPVNFRLAAPEISYILKDSEAEIFFVSREFLPVAQKAAAEAECSPKIVLIDGDGSEAPLYQNWRDAAPADDPDLPGAADDDVLQLYTSGTTGRPKGVQQTNKSWSSFAQMCVKVQGLAYGRGEAVMNAMPFFHVAGVNVGVSGLVQGARLVIVDDITPEKIFDLIEREAVKHAFFVPAVILMLINAPGFSAANVSSLRSIAYGGSPIAEDVLLRAQERFGCDFLQFYGMTETTGAGASLPPAAHDPAKGKLRSCGVPWSGVDMKIIGAEGEALRDGEIGEVAIRTNTLMKGYFNKPEATRAAIDGGWMRTGDAGYRDADGFYFLCDRIKDMIVTGGENVYPAEVENALMAHPHVKDAAVIGVPDEKWGEAVKAVVVPACGVDINSQAIIEFLRTQIANYKVPKSFDLIDEIPRTPSGKILHRVLREPFWAGRGRRIG